MATAQEKNNQRAADIRENNATLSMINYMRESHEPVQAEIDRVFRVYGTTDAQGREVIDTTRYNRRRQAVTLAAIAAIAPILVRRDNFSRRSTKNSYDATYNENAWVSANAIGNVKQFPDPTKRMLQAAFEVPQSKLADAASMGLDRKKFVNRVNRSLLQGFNEGKTITQMSKDIDKIFGFRDASGKLVIPVNPTPAQLDKLPKYIQWDAKNKRFLHLRQDGKVIPITRTTTPRIPTGGEIYNSTRVVRTEMHRIQGAAAVDSMKAGQDMGIDERLQKISVLDNRTRQQSRIMDGQISNKEGLFKYPGIAEPRPLGNSGNPAFDINDRGTAAPVILDFDDELKEQVELAESQGRAIQYDTFQSYAAGNRINIDRYGEVYLGPNA